MEDLRVIWDYLRLNMKPEKADCIIGFGCINDDVAKRSAELYLDGYAPKILFTGGLGRNTLGRWNKSEAERFCDIATELGVPRKDILIENKSTNSGENIDFSREVLAQNNMAVSKILAVHKPYMERRVFAALRKKWPEVTVITASANIDMEDYIALTMKQGLDEKEIIETIVGDLQRMDRYAELGFQIKQEIPDNVWTAFDNLVKKGYDGQLVK